MMKGMVINMRERRVKQPIVSIAQSKSEPHSIIKALDLLPMGDILKKGDKVVITPNWVNARPPMTGTIVGPETLRELIQHVKRYQPGQIIVATGSGGGNTPDIFNEFGYDKVIEEEKVEFVDVNFGPYIELELEHSVINKTKINRLIDELDVLISFTQLKQHEEATISAAIKNIALGWPPAEIHGFPKKQLGIHEDLHGFIAAMAKKLPIDLSIISADKAMIGTGPSNGIAVDTQGLIIASTDPVAADTIGARLLGFKPQAIHYLYSLYKGGFGEGDPKKMIMKGVSLEEAERSFSLAAYGQEIVLDKKES
jgi:uncharacterized protein (DUF362 family)